MSKSMKTVILTCVSVVSALAGSAFSQTSWPTTHELPAGVPPRDVWLQGEPITRFGNNIVRTLSCRTVNKTVELSWQYSDPATSSPATPNNVRSVTPEIYATSYWPTYVLVLTPYTFCVAGKARNGDVVLEQWTFANASALGTPAPSVSPYASTTSGEVFYSWTLPPRVQVTELLRTSATPSGLIRALIRDAGSTQHLLVYYDGSRAVSRINLVTGDASISASPTAQGDALVVPALASSFGFNWVADHVDKGYCYFLCNLPEASSVPPGSPLALVLVDSNRDGKLDSSSLLTVATWQSGGWADPTKLTTIYQ